jgi:hypothetical protein
MVHVSAVHILDTPVRNFKAGKPDTFFGVVSPEETYFLFANLAYIPYFEIIKVGL